jgi:hypothetical protein
LALRLPARNDWTPSLLRICDEEVWSLEASGRKLAYGDLIGGASQLVPPKDPSLKALGDFRTIGKPLKR